MSTSTIDPRLERRRLEFVDSEHVDPGGAAEAHGHGVCWAAVVAGALGAASLSLILVILGVGLGLSSVSPWSNAGISAETLGASTIAWLAFTQLAASGVGGYLAGRLRTRWSAAVSSDEVYFRDTAHGFLAWSLATLVTAGLLSTAVSSIVGGSAKVGMAVESREMTPTVRVATPVPGIEISPQAPAEPASTVAAAAASASTVDAKAAADKARKASAYASLWMFISLLVGAFIASWVALIGGRHRDQP